ncbi:hypothetical protein ACLOJK_039764 [Asimina triloba]
MLEGESLERGRDVSASRTYRLQLQGYRSTDRERRKSPSAAAMTSRLAAARRKGIASSSRWRRLTALPSPSSSSRLLPLRQVTVGKVSHLPVSILLCSGRYPPLDEPLSSAVSILLGFGRHPPLDEPLSSAHDLRPLPPSSLSRPLLPLLSSSARPSALSPQISPSPPASLRPIPPPALPPLFLRLPPPPSAPSRPLFSPAPCSLRSPRFPLSPDLAVSASLRTVPPPTLPPSASTYFLTCAGGVGINMTAASNAFAQGTMEERMEAVQAQKQ